jgi:hypothetical protein
MRKELMLVLLSLVKTFTRVDDLKLKKFYVIYRLSLPLLTSATFSFVTRWVRYDREFE